MVKEWATVIHWHEGRALLRYGSSLAVVVVKLVPRVVLIY